MEFSDITGAIHDFWIFIWPPFMMFLIVWTVSNTYCRTTTREWMSSAFKNIENYRGNIESLRESLEPYGLSKLIPTASAIIVIFLLYIFNGPITQISSMFPPNLVFTPTEFHLSHSSRYEKLLLLKSYPSASSLYEAYDLARNEFAYEAREAREQYDRTQIHNKIQNFLKFALICTFILFFFHKKSGVSLLRLMWRFIGCILMISVLWMFSFPFLLFGYEQSLFDESNAIKTKIQEKMAGVEIGDPTEKEERIISTYLDNKDSRDWWELRIYDKYMIHWVGRTILNLDNQ